MPRRRSQHVLIGTLFPWRKKRSAVLESLAIHSAMNDSLRTFRNALPCAKKKLAASWKSLRCVPRRTPVTYSRNAPARAEEKQRRDHLRRARGAFRVRTQETARWRKLAPPKVFHICVSSASILEGALADVESKDIYAAPVEAGIPMLFGRVGRRYPRSGNVDDRLKSWSRTDLYVSHRT